MRPAFILICIGLVTASGAASADPVVLDVAGNEFVVTAAEHSTTHNEFQSETSSFVFHRESYTSGATVNGEGASVTAYTIDRESVYDGPAGYVSNSATAVGVSGNANAAGFTSQQSANAAVTNTEWDFGSLEHGEGHHLSTNVRMTNWGNGVADSHSVASGVGVGQFESGWMNSNPTLGFIGFVNVGAYAQNHANAAGYALGAYGGAWEYGYVGDYTGGDSSASARLARCQGFSCQWNDVGYNVCLLGVRPPFFVACALA